MIRDQRLTDDQQEAEALIRRLREDGRLIYRLNPETGEGTEKVTGLAELGEENVAIPRIVGG